VLGIKITYSAAIVSKSSKKQAVELRSIGDDAELKIGSYVSP